MIVQPGEPATARQIQQVHQAAQRHGLDPAPAHHPAVLFAYLRGLASGQYAAHDDPIGAVHRSPPGSLHIPRTMPRPVEEYLAEVRSLFSSPVNSSSAHVDFTRDDAIGLIYADRLDEAAERARSDRDIARRAETLFPLSQLSLARDQPNTALRHADDAVRLRADDEDAWIAKGSAELVSGDTAAARDSLRQIDRINPHSIGGTALQAALEYLAGSDAAPATLARAITLGALTPPSAARPRHDPVASNTRDTTE